MKAIVFPGQGSEYTGMGKDLYDNFPQAREMFLRIDDMLEIEISRICFEGKEETLKGIYYQQLAILATCLVTYELFKTKDIDIDFLSGLSLGEYICLYPAGVLDLASLIYLVKARAEATQRASEVYSSCMLAVIGLETEFLEAKSKQEDFHLANVNSHKQVVISLKKEDKQRIKKTLQSSGARVIEIEVNGGFHSPLMDLAKERFKEFTDTLEFKQAKVPIVSNVTARAHTDKDAIKNNIVEQLTSPALWRGCVELMIKEGVDTFFEIGPSRVLGGLIKRINPNINVINIEKKEDLDELNLQDRISSRSA